MRKWWLWIIVIVVLIAGVVVWLKFRKAVIVPLEQRKADAGKVKDEAASVGRTAESMPGADEDYYADMDYGVTKNPAAVYATLKDYLPANATPADAVRAAVIGRNNWVVWTAGNDRLWDVLSVASVGNLDLLKTVSNHPSLKWNRSQRWKWYGLVNEPCYRIKNDGGKPAGRADRFGLYLDERVTDGPCAAPDPFENEQKYPGVKVGARGSRPNFPAGSYYGYATGVVGLRLFPNPAFDAAAEKAWDPERYYTDKSYYNNPKLVKPYRVGMSCGFCHVGPNPTKPPKDPENPQWSELNSNPGAQWFWISRIFMFDQDHQSFVWQLFNTSRPGALDTSLVSSDQINNPRTMNAIYNLHARLLVGKLWGHEELGGGSTNNAQFNDYAPKYIRDGTLLTELYDKPKVVRTTHVLKDGSDAVGALGALNRVYVNIGLDSEEWLLHFFPLIGGASLPLTKISPIEITAMRANSTYWNANEAQTPFVALFFLAASPPDLLQNAPGGPGYLAKDANLIPRGKVVFAERCARCHSSKQPQKVFNDYFKPGCVGPNYMKCWNDYWNYSKTPEYKTAMTQMVNDPTFLQDNFLSMEVRVPSTLLETNLCSPLATNAIRDNIWDNFSSESYKQLPSVGAVTVHDPYSGAARTPAYAMPAGGRGYTRPASLISLWSTAPYLQNNTLGSNKGDDTYHDNGKAKYYNLDRSVPFDDYPDVPGRVAAFEDGITQLLWPEKRAGNIMFQTASGKTGPGWVDRTTERTWLNVMPGYLPPFLAKTLGKYMNKAGNPNRPPQPGLNIGPIPSGTPVNLLTNINLEETDLALKAVAKLTEDLLTLPKNATDEEVTAHFANAKQDLLNVSKCPDFIVNRGHYFGTDFLPASEGEPGLSDDDKKALIAFLRTF